MKKMKKHEDAKQDKAMIKKEIAKASKKDKKDDMKTIKEYVKNKH
jgi:hypothetical protein